MKTLLILTLPVMIAGTFMASSQLFEQNSHLLSAALSLTSWAALSAWVATIGAIVSKKLNLKF